MTATATPMPPREGDIPVDYLTIAAKVVDTSGVVEMLAEWQKNDREGQEKHPGGGPAKIEVGTALNLFVLPALLGKSMFVSESCKIMRDRLPGKAWQQAGLDLALFKDRRDLHLYDCLWRTLRRNVRDVIDPYPETLHGRRLTKDEYAELEGSRDPEFVRSRHARSALFMSRLAFASAMVMQDNVFTDWPGDIAIDATAIEVTGYSNSKRSHRVPTTPEAGWYIRDGDHKGDGLNGVEGIKKSAWAFEATVVVALGGRFANGLPAPVVGLYLDRPGYAPAYNARAALAVLEATDLPRRYAITDMAYYPGAKPENYQIPMHKQGWKLVGDIPDRPGVKEIAATHRGAVIVDGHAFCPAIKHRPDLLDPKGALDRGDITEAEFKDRIEQRRVLQLTVKETGNDGSVRFACPALSGKVTCPLRARDAQTRKKATAKAGPGHRRCRCGPPTRPRRARVVTCARKSPSRSAWATRTRHARTSTCNKARSPTATNGATSTSPTVPATRALTRSLRLNRLSVSVTGPKRICAALPVSQYVPLLPLWWRTCASTSITCDHRPTARHRRRHGAVGPAPQRRRWASPTLPDPTRHRHPARKLHDRTQVHTRDTGMAYLPWTGSEKGIKPGPQISPDRRTSG
ncbi:hypothetical protein [Corynebacterium antarcticum]|uniref:hypothetical protein n=1 Tax=Corynebacterium antarcticum TaxID=2800405 RepID=UPI002002A39D|nr:hypothetical protein [Corynebacterium antarcticum]MCK7660051.1 hypothetical protein [Corynebacterium antarcticum]